MSGFIAAADVAHPAGDREREHLDGAASVQVVANGAEEPLRQFLRAVHGDLLRAMRQRRIGEAGHQRVAIGDVDVAVQAFEDLHATLLVPMHWGTFELNREPFSEPPDRLMAEALRHGLEEHVAPLSPGQTIRW